MTPVTSRSIVYCPARFRGRMVFALVVYGIVLAFVTPPFQTADEQSHLMRTYMISRGELAVRTEGSITGQDVPTGLLNYIGQHSTMFHDVVRRYSYERWHLEAIPPADENSTTLTTFSTQSSSPIYFIPQTLGVWVGRVLYALSPAQFSWSGALYFARLGNLAAYVLVFAWAVSIAPRFATTLMFLAFTPMSLSLAASASYDVSVILSCVAFFAAVMREADQSGPVSRRTQMILILLSFLVGHAKTVYAPVLLALFLLRGRLARRSMLILATGCGAAACFGSVVSSQIFGLPERPELQEAMREQTTYVLGHLATLPGLVWRSLFEYSDRTFESMLGRLGWMNVHIAAPIIVAWFGVGLACVFGDGLAGRRPTPLVDAAMLLSGSAIAVFLLFVVMYITWTSLTTGIGGPLVDSVQGRYLLPLFPFLLGGGSFIISAIARPAYRWRIWIADAAFSAASAVSILTVLTIVFRYWIPQPP